MGKYFLYRHIREDKNIPFYIGIGTKRDRPWYRWTAEYERAYCKVNRNKYWKSIVNISEYRVEIIFESDFYKEIQNKEKEVILIYSNLSNMTTGGEGAPGVTAWNKGTNMWRGKGHPNLGKKLSIETCRRKSEGMKNSERSLKGKKLPAWWVAKIAKGVSGASNPMFGKRGQETPMAKHVLDLATGIYWESVTEASEIYGHKMKTLYNKLSGFRRNNTNLILA